MKNGRFSEKKSGKRWLTSTWKASLSTWLKSGLIVASAVISEVTPYFTERPASGSESAGAYVSGVARDWRYEYVTLGASSRVSGRSRSRSTSVAWRSRKL